MKNEYTRTLRHFMLQIGSEKTQVFNTKQEFYKMID